jgi:hypothetical protein
MLVNPPDSATFVTSVIHNLTAQQPLYQQSPPDRFLEPLNDRIWPHDHISLKRPAPSLTPISFTPPWRHPRFVAPAGFIY